MNSIFSTTRTRKFSSLLHHPLGDLYRSNNQVLIAGHCTIEGTQRFKERAMTNHQIPKLHFRKPMHIPLELSSVGLGTYLGAPEDSVDSDVFRAAKILIERGGINVIDTAINYRCQKAERTIGAVLRHLEKEDIAKRDELFICTKNGYIPDDSDNGIPGSLLIEQMISNGDITKEDIAGQIHCLHPSFLSHQFQKSRENLGIASIDLLYIHNAYESQAIFLPNHSAFINRLSKAFEFLEGKRKEGQLQFYGMATWLCFRSKPEEEKIHLALQEVVELAEKVGGKNKHGFRFVQVPMGVLMPEAFAEKWQEFKTPAGYISKESTELKILVSVCNLLKMNLIASKPILEGRVREIDIPQITNIKDPVAKHIQLVRSMPPRCLISTLVGMKSLENVNKNLEVLKTPPLTKSEFQQIMKIA